MPWIHLHVDTNGLVKACCNSSITYGDVNKESLNQIWNGNSIKEFRSKILKGEKDRRCSACWKREDAGKSSIRTETLNKFKSSLSLLDNTGKDGQCNDSSPIYLDIRFSNVCNLKCRTCWHGASSSWFEDAKQLGNNYGDKAIIKAVENNEMFMDQLFSLDQTPTELYFAGGEPLMMEEHYEMLHHYINKGATNIHLRYNTNLSRLNLKEHQVLELWKQFDQVTILVSIDHLYEKAEYIRKGLRWKELIYNFKKIKEHCPHVNLQIAPTVSIFNALSLAELHRFFVEEGYIDLDQIYLNTLHRPDYFNIQVLPRPLKLRAKRLLESHLRWLKQKQATARVMEEFEATINYLLAEDKSTLYPIFLKHTERLDELREESLSKVFPELV